MMKVRFALFGFFVLILACRPERKSTDIKTINIEYPEINAANFEQKLLENVKHFEQEPMYYMRINKSNCLLEVLVNDYPIHKDYTLSNYATPLDINRGILKSGEQKLTYRLYPTGDLIKEEYGEGDSTITLTDNTSISISIIKMDGKGGQTLEDEQVVMKHNNLTNSKGHFIASGKPYYEFTFNFKAEVPYVNEGWSKGQDLTKLDREVLEQKTLEFYKEYASVYENRNADLLAKLKFGTERRNAVALYKKEPDIKELWKELLSDVKANNTKIQPIENYKTVFFYIYRKEKKWKMVCT